MIYEVINVPVGGERARLLGKYRWGHHDKDVRKSVGRLKIVNTQRERVRILHRNVKWASLGIIILYTNLCRTHFTLPPSMQFNKFDRTKIVIVIIGVLLVTISFLIAHRSSDSLPHRIRFDEEVEVEAI